MRTHSIRLSVLIALGLLAVATALVLIKGAGRDDPNSKTAQPSINTALPDCKPLSAANSVTFPSGTITLAEAKRLTTTPLDSSVPQPSTPAPPDHGLRISAPQEVMLWNAEMGLDAEFISTSDLDGDLLVGVAIVRGGGQAVVAIDLVSGQSGRLSEIVDHGVEGPRVSGHYVAWLERIQDESELHVFDLSASCGSVINRRIVTMVDLKDNLLVWREYRGSTSVIAGYELDTGHERTIVEESLIYGFPKVCSRQWIIYLRNYPEDAHNGWPGKVELRSHNLATDQDSGIGRMRFPRAANAGRQHACDGTQVAWIPSPVDASSESYEQHLYNLADGSDRVLFLTGISSLPGYTELDGDILVTDAGYDLRTDTPFEVRKLFQPPAGTYLASHSRLVWNYLADAGNPPHLYTASITRDGTK